MEYVWEHLHDCPGHVQLRWVAAGLVLDEDCITATKGGQAVGVLARPRTWSFDRARSRCSRLLSHSLCDWKRGGIPGRRSLVARPKRLVAGDMPVSGSGTGGGPCGRS